MAFLKQKIHLKPILGNIGLILHVPALMAFFTLIIGIIFGEIFALIPFLTMGVICLIVAQVLFYFFYQPKIILLWDAMISCALSWLICPFFAAIPFYWIANISSEIGVIPLRDPLNAFFEAFSGFTSTGLTMIKKPSALPHVLQWWRAFSEWIGGVGLIAIVLSFVEPKHEDYQLFYAETRSKDFKGHLLQTIRNIWFMYVTYTLMIAILFFLFGMPLWASICHSLSGISTGGFSINDNSFVNYSFSIHMIAILAMSLGAISFSMHQKLLYQKKIFCFFKNEQNLLFIIFLISGSLFLYLISDSTISSIFQWTSSLGTCGFYSINLSHVSASYKHFLIIGMIIGGCSGSTVGGIKIRRVIYLFQAIKVRLKSFTLQKEKRLKLYQTDQEKAPSGVLLPKGHKTERLYEASVLFTLWICTLVIGWFLLNNLIHGENSLDLLFDAASALSNVGLSSGITNSDLFWGSKIVLIMLMWLGRLEIIPILVLVLSYPLILSKEH